MPFFMIRNDITKVHADAIVNPANEKLLQGSGTSRGIYMAAGEEKLTKACSKIGYCQTGKAVATRAFGLSAKRIIHAVGPVWQDGEQGEEGLLYSTYMESLKLAKSYRLKSIAFPLLSSGSYGFPKERALRTAIDAISDFLMENEMKVYIVVYDRSAVALSKKLFDSVEEYIDDNYVEENDELFYQSRPYFEEYDLPSYNRRSDIKEIPLAAAPPLTSVAAPKSSQRSLDSLINNLEETFSQMLLRLIDERGLKDSYVYKKANIDRRHFSKIRKDINYAPNKKTVLAFAIALKLTLDETKDLLMRAGYAFSRSSKFDIIICYFIENQKYDIFEINEVLFAYEQPILGE